MKTLTIISISAAFVLASCGSSRYAAYGEYDDVYYNPESSATFTAEETMATQSLQIVAEQPLDQDTSYLKGLSDYERYRLEMDGELDGEVYEPDGSETVYVNENQDVQYYDEGDGNAPIIINNNYYGSDDYYYSSRLRRFSDSYYGWDYYDPYYTDMYFYTGRPYHWGMRMGYSGFGYGYGYPFYDYGYGYGYGYGYPYYGYNSWYSPWNNYSSYYYPGYYGYYDYGYYDYGYSRYNRSRYYNRYYSGSGHNHSRYYNSSLSSRSSYGYSSSGIHSSTQSRKNNASSNDIRYRTREQLNSGLGVTRNTDTFTDTRGKTSTDPKRGDTSSPGATKLTREDGQSRTTTAVKNSSSQKSSVQSTRTYTPSYTRPRTSSSVNRGTTTRPATVTRSSTTTRPATVTRSTTTTRPTTTTRSTTTNRSSYSRPSSSSSSSSTYSRPSSSSSSSSYSRPSSSSSSSSYSRPSSSSTRSSSSYSRPSSSSSRSSSSYSRPSSSSSRSSSSYSSGSSRSSSSSSSSRSSSSSSSSRSSGSRR